LLALRADLSPLPRRPSQRNAVTGGVAPLVTGWPRVLQGTSAPDRRQFRDRWPVSRPGARRPATARCVL